MGDILKVDFHRLDKKLPIGQINIIIQKPANTEIININEHKTERSITIFANTVTSGTRLLNKYLNNENVDIRYNRN